MLGKVLIDNFTLQGAYCYLFEGKKYGIYKSCLANLLECLVAYDRIVIPAGVSEINLAVRNIVNRFGKIIEDSYILTESDSLPENELEEKSKRNKHREPLVPPQWVSVFPYVEIELDEVKEYYSRVVNIILSHPFEEYISAQEELLWIAQTGGSDYFVDDFYSFQLYHTWYASYCLASAREEGVHYAPNPTRINLIGNKNFNNGIVLHDARQIILDEISLLKKKIIDEVKGLVEFTTFDISFPLIYSYIVRAANYDPEKIISITLQTRESAPAKAFRERCHNLQEGLDRDDISYLLQQKTEINKYVADWSKHLTNKRTKTVTLNAYLISTTIDIPDLEIVWPFRQKHFVFLHQLLEE